MAKSELAAVPVIVLSQTKEGSDPFIKPSDLPSARYRYDVWHELEKNKIYADELKNPRIRKGPHDRDEASSSSGDSDDEEKGSGGNRRKKKKDRRLLSIRRNYRDEHENWKEAIIVNLSYQNLGDDFQTSNFKAVLGLLRSCVNLQLMSNELRDLSRITLPQCKYLNLTWNHIKSFKNLPKAPMLESLNLTENDISDFDGIERFKNLKILHLTRNPVSYSFDYRAHAFEKVPSLKWLDGTPKLEADDKFDYPRDERSCVVM